MDRGLPEWRVVRSRGCDLSRAERQVRYEYYRKRYLPAQIDAARAKLRHLEAEAARLGINGGEAA